MKQSADDNFEFDVNSRKFSKLVQNTVGKGEIGCYEQFLLFPQCFQKACFPGASKGVNVWEWVKYVDILTIMRDPHEIAISLRHLHGILRKVNQRRRVYIDLPEIIHFALGELETSGRFHGYRMMRQRGAANGLHVQTQDVADIMRMCDPIGNIKVLKVLTDLRI